MKALFSVSSSESAVRDAGHFLTEVFRCPEGAAAFVPSGKLSDRSGYFRLGPDVTCYGQCSSGDPARSVTDPLHDALGDVTIENSAVQLPFDPVQVVDNLRSERYLAHGPQGAPALPANAAIRALYYALRPAMSVPVRKHFQKLYLRGREKTPFPKWPVDVTVEKLLERLLVFAMKSQKMESLPFIWFWPDGAPTCTTISHDVETEAGRDFCPQLMDLDDYFGVKTSFQIIPEGRYSVPKSLVRGILDRGFEVNVHDLNHDGHLFRSREQFLLRAERINEYGRQYGSQGFRSAVMYRNVDWLDALEFSYDMSVPNVAHLDPQRGGCCTVLPFFAGRILELPLTTTQDYSLLNILKDYSIRLWKEQIAVIRERHGLISFIVHPDYTIDPAARRVYCELLRYLTEMRSRGETWIASPGEVAAWWRLRSGLNLVKAMGSWRIEGKGKERAVVAHAVIAGDGLRFETATRC